jgi:hypothetical protein
MKTRVRYVFFLAVSYLFTRRVKNEEYAHVSWYGVIAL